MLSEVVILSDIAVVAEQVDSLTPDDSTINIAGMIDLKGQRKSGAIDLPSVAFASAPNHPTPKLESDDDSSSVSARRDLFSMNSSGEFEIRNLLDRWEEPENKQDKASSCTPTEKESHIHELTVCVDSVSECFP